MSKNRIMGNQPEKSDVTAAPDTVEGDSHTAMTPRQRLTVLATGLGIFMVFVDVNIVNVALPSIQKVFTRANKVCSGRSPGTAWAWRPC